MILNFQNTVESINNPNIYSNPGGISVAATPVWSNTNRTLTYTFTSASTPTLYVATIFVTISGVQIRWDLPRDANFENSCTALPTPIIAFTVPAKLTSDSNFAITTPTSNNTPATFTYTSSNTGVSTIVSTNQIHIVGAGTSVITATQPASGSYSIGIATALFIVSGIPTAAPSVAAPTPTRCSGDVVSVYSGAYNPAAGTRNYNPNWGQNGYPTNFTQPLIAGDQVNKYTGVNYQGMDIGTPINATATGMTYVHIDIWSTNCPKTDFIIVDTGDRSKLLDTPLGQWNSFDILLTDFVGLDKTNINQLKFQKSPFNSSIDRNEWYFDNIYFYRVPATPTFTQMPAVCSGAMMAALPTTSNNGINGTWSPALNNTATTLYTFTTAGTCPNATTMTIIVNPRPTSTVSGTATTCDGTAKTISVAMTGTGPWNLTYIDGTTPISITAIASSPYTFSVTPTSTKTYTVTALSDSKCTAIAADMTGSAVVTVNARPATPGTITGTATQCPGLTAQTYSIPAVTNATTYNWTVPTGWPITAGAGTTSITVTTGLGGQGGSISVTAQNSCGTSTAQALAVTVNSSSTWTGAPNTNWFTATNWSCGSVPTANTDVIIPNGSQLIVDDTSTIALANTITVSASSSLTVNSGNTLKVTDKVTNNDGGTITFEDTASLVQTNNVANSGNIIYKRTTSILANNYDFVYWGSPVAAQEIGKIWMASNWADTFYNYNPGTPGWARTYAANTMTPGKGYIARARNGQQGWDYNNNVSTFTLGGTWPATFSGVPNNGTISITDCEAGKYCLLGNPYPSAIDADKFLSANSSVLDGTLYFWTHNTPLANNAYNSNDYASYNGVGGTKTTRATSSGLNTSIPTGKIAAGQGFFAKATATATVTFNNTIRVGTEGAPLVNTQFFRTSNTKAKTTNSIEKHRVWLNVSNTQGVFKQTLVGYVTDATNAYDSRFDGESMNGNTYTDFYSINENKNLTIQGRAVPFDENDTVPLGFKTTIAGSFTIDIDDADGLLTNQAVYLEDKVTNTIFNLKNGNYTFTIDKGTFNDRFVLRYTDKTLGTAAVEKPANQILVTVQNKQIKITSFAETIEKVFVYDVSGKQCYQRRNVNNTELLITTLALSHQILLVKTVLQNGKSSTKKVLF
jgi:hypothetical protein